MGTGSITLDLRPTDRVLVLDPEEFDWLERVVDNARRTEHLSPERSLRDKIKAAR